MTELINVIHWIAYGLNKKKIDLEIVNNLQILKKKTNLSQL